MKSLIKIAAMNAGATALYIAFIATGLFYTSAERFGQQTPTVFIPIFMLMLFVFSATVTSSLMLGRPVLWYLEGKKKDALRLFAYTIGMFLLFLIAAAILLFIF